MKWNFVRIVIALAATIAACIAATVFGFTPTVRNACVVAAVWLFVEALVVITHIKKLERAAQELAYIMNDRKEGGDLEIDWRDQEALFKKQGIKAANRLKAGMPMWPLTKTVREYLVWMIKYKTPDLTPVPASQG